MHEHSRIILSQDRHEIYISVAEYDLQWEKYIKGLDTGLHNNAGFMKVAQYGPYMLSVPRDMLETAKIILAIQIRG
jgi:hypothetical protein